MSQRYYAARRLAQALSRADLDLVDRAFVLAKAAWHRAFMKADTRYRQGWNSRARKGMKRREKAMLAHAARVGPACPVEVVE